MPYVQRSNDGSILVLLDAPSPEALEHLEPDDPEVLSHLDRTARAEGLKHDLQASDADMARVVEDLVALLIAKGVIDPAELPKAARDKLERRRHLRQKLTLPLVAGDGIL